MVAPSGAAAPAARTRDAVLRVLADVLDPEVPVLSVVELGIVRDVELTPDAVTVVVTPTYSGCPAVKVIEDDILAALRAHGHHDARVRTAFSPPWTTDWLSEAGREKLRAYGVAPPAGAAGGRRALFGEDPAVACPRCGSADTERVSEFGSTACKALHRCRACREPFDRFKCV